MVLCSADAGKFLFRLLVLLVLCGCVALSSVSWTILMLLQCRRPQARTLKYVLLQTLSSILPPWHAGWTSSRRDVVIPCGGSLMRSETLVASSMFRASTVSPRCRSELYDMVGARVGLCGCGPASADSRPGVWLCVKTNVLGEYVAHRMTHLEPPSVRLLLLRSRLSDP